MRLKNSFYPLNLASGCFGLALSAFFSISCSEKAEQANPPAEASARLLKDVMENTPCTATKKLCYDLVEGPVDQRIVGDLIDADGAMVLQDERAIYALEMSADLAPIVGAYSGKSVALSANLASKVYYFIDDGQESRRDLVATVNSLYCDLRHSEYCSIVASDRRTHQVIGLVMRDDASGKVKLKSVGKESSIEYVVFDAELTSTLQGHLGHIVQCAADFEKVTTDQLLADGTPVFQVLSLKACSPTVVGAIMSPIESCVARSLCQAIEEVSHRASVAYHGRIYIEVGDYQTRLVLASDDGNRYLAGEAAIDLLSLHGQEVLVSGSAKIFRVTTTAGSVRTEEVVYPVSVDSVDEGIVLVNSQFKVSLLEGRIILQQTLGLSTISYVLYQHYTSGAAVDAQVDTRTFLDRYFIDEFEDIASLYAGETLNVVGLKGDLETIAGVSFRRLTPLSMALDKTGEIFFPKGSANLPKFDASASSEQIPTAVHLIGKIGIARSGDGLLPANLTNYLASLPDDDYVRDQVADLGRTAFPYIKVRHGGEDIYLILLEDGRLEMDPTENVVRAEAGPLMRYAGTGRNFLVSGFATSGIQEPVVIDGREFWFLYVTYVSQHSPLQTCSAFPADQLCLDTTR